MMGVLRAVAGALDCTVGVAVGAEGAAHRTGVEGREAEGRKEEALEAVHGDGEVHDGVGVAHKLPGCRNCPKSSDSPPCWRSLNYYLRRTFHQVG